MPSKTRKTSDTKSNHHAKGSSEGTPITIKNEAGIDIAHPDVSQPTICLRVPEMRNEVTYWQVNTSPMTCVKINTLRGEVKINTEEAGLIPKMEAVCLGTAIIHVFNRSAKVYVTRSKRRLPMICDGILGTEFHGVHWCLDPWRVTIRGIPPSVPVLTGEELIPDYSTKLRRLLDEAKIADARGQWAVISERLTEVRKFLRPEVANNSLEPVLEILEDYADCFYLPDEKLTCTKLLKYEIRSSSDKVINVPQQKLSSNDWSKIDAHVDCLLQNGIIQVSDSPYNSSIRSIERKPDFRGNVRYCLAPDFDELNKNSESDALPIPDIEELTTRLHGSKYFSVFDLASACYQIELEPEDRKKTAFSTRTQRYEFLRMPLGIKNASQNIQRLLNRVLDDMLYSPSSMAFVSYDDIIVYSRTIEEHEVRVRTLLSRIQNAGLKLQPSKCQMFSESVHYLGYLITKDGLRPDPEKVGRIRDCELPKTRHSLSSFLGLLSFFKRFIPHHADRIKPMSNLFKSKDQKDFSWTREANESFNDIKQLFSQELLLRYPNLNETFILETDVSKVGIRAALLQTNPQNGETFPIAYASRCYTPEELSYKTPNRARLAAMYGMDTWHWYLDNRTCKKFILRTPKPEAFDWHVRHRPCKSTIVKRFAASYRHKEFTAESLDGSKK